MKKNKIKLRLTVALTAMALTLTVALGNILNSKSVYFLYLISNRLS